MSWDERFEGVDTVRASDGSTLRLFSAAMQAPPQTGWVLMLTGGNSEAGYRWTLYGLPQSH